MMRPLEYEPVPTTLTDNELHHLRPTISFTDLETRCELFMMVGGSSFTSELPQTGYLWAEAPMPAQAS